MVTAYVRVSTEKQDLSNQKHEIARYALSRQIVVDRWVEETVSGTVSKKERSLNDLISGLERGDTLIVTEISRLSRTLLEILSIVKDCVERGVHVYSVKDGFTFDNSINSTVLLFAFGLVSEIERKLISERTKAALIKRKEEGMKLGRPIGSSPQLKILLDNKETVTRRLESGDSIIEICKSFGVSRNTFDRFRKIYLKHEDVE